jgi:hypothetical protein
MKIFFQNFFYVSDPHCTLLFYANAAVWIERGCTIDLMEQGLKMCPGVAFDQCLTGRWQALGQSLTKVGQAGAVHRANGTAGVEDACAFK